MANKQFRMKKNVCFWLHWVQENCFWTNIEINVFCSIKYVNASQLRTLFFYNICVLSYENQQMVQKEVFMNVTKKITNSLPKKIYYVQTCQKKVSLNTINILKNSFESFCWFYRSKHKYCQKKVCLNCKAF